MIQRQILLFSIFLILLTSSLAFQEASKAENGKHVSEFVNHHPFFPAKRSTLICLCGITSYSCCPAKTTLPKVGLIDNQFYMIFTVYT